MDTLKETFVLYDPAGAVIQPRSPLRYNIKISTIYICLLRNNLLERGVDLLSLCEEKTEVSVGMNYYWLSTGMDWILNIE